MGEERFKARDVLAGNGEMVSIRKLRNRRLFSNVYQNASTLKLDDVYGLDGERQDSEEERVQAVGRYGNEWGCSIFSDKTKIVGRVVVSYLGLGKRGGNFYGFLESEFYRALRRGIFGRRVVSREDIEFVLSFTPAETGGRGFLRRVNVRGMNVLFPSELNLFAPHKDFTKEWKRIFC